MVSMHAPETVAEIVEKIQNFEDGRDTEEGRKPEPWRWDEELEPEPKKNKGGKNNSKNKNNEETVDLMEEFTKQMAALEIKKAEIMQMTNNDQKFNNNGKQPFNNNRRFNNNGYNNQRMNTACYNCGKPGHIARNCYSNNGNSNQSGYNNNNWRNNDIDNLRNYNPRNSNNNNNQEQTPAKYVEVINEEQETEEQDPDENTLVTPEFLEAYLGKRERPFEGNTPNKEQRTKNQTMDTFGNSKPSTLPKVTWNNITPKDFGKEQQTTLRPKTKTQTRDTKKGRTPRELLVTKILNQEVEITLGEFFEAFPQA
ncbi:hypothetical protein Glove_425g7 [Diversispora epigaea]|uniref:CCHC-type domain-containing protein n=1 Tax=Diversispora epigaea TaxID=1348612 RepID=A0A397GWH1_9GLOM|nr:hypothetical protein Glove_425g7 [Diversispora epigaea]